VRINPAYTDARKKLALVHYRRGDFERAQAEVAAASKSSPDFADLYKIRGDILMHRGETGQARAAYTEATSINPDYAEATFGLVIALRKEGRGREADQALRRFIVNHPADVMARTLLTVDKIPIPDM
jgi:tetratricopeptide (TPR) repeat protein